MRFYLFFVLALSLTFFDAKAQTTRDFAIDLKADVAASAPFITLSWTQRQQANITAQAIYRRVKGDAAWVLQANLTTTDTSYADNTAVAGVNYEYWMKRTYTTIFPSTPMGYISAGVNLPMVENRGKLLLVVDDTMTTNLAPEIAQLQTDLSADGWQVQTIIAPRTGTAIDTKALIKAAYDADSANIKQVYVLGHVPVPYSGNQNPDGHGNHVGAWSADGFYGDMDGTWTDTSVNNTSSTDPRTQNIPGDGKLDQSNIPSTLELMVGRVDLANMQRAPSTAASETLLLRRYLRKAHDFRYKQGAYAAIDRRVLIRDGFGYFGGENFMTTGWSWGFTCVGRPPAVIFDEAPSGDWWTQAAANTYLMANGNGGGSFETCSSVGATADFGRRPFRAAFVSLFGSYFGDWDITNNFMRAPLAGNATGDGLGLCCFWAGRPAWFMHHMSMGETLGYSIRQSMNSQFSSVSNPVYTPVNFPGGGTNCGLVGDPALRMHVVEPPRNLVATTSGSQVNLGWSASTETALLGYHVYRSSTPAGPFTRLTASVLASPSYVDSTATAGLAYTYMVRTLKLETSPGGTYQNLSQGHMASLTVNASASAAPLNPTSLAVTQNSSVNAQLTWLDNASNETGYRIERKTNGGGAYATVASVAANATSYTDPGPLTQGNVYYYRVFATGSAGDSIASNEISFDAIAGYFEFNDTYTKINKTVGTALIPVKRFGGVTGSVTVNFATANSSATAGTHYTAASGTLTWADGETGIKNISVPITNTGSAQQARQFRVTLSSPSTGTGLGTYSAISVLIEDPTATLPAPWLQATIGTVTSTSTSTQAEGGISSVTIGGTGLATAATSESGQFIYQTKSGDGVLTALVPAASPAQTGARYAVMIRENVTSGGALMAGTVTSSSTSFGSKQVYRTTTGGAAIFAGNALTAVNPQWIRITRAGNSFTSEYSADGTAWVGLGTVTVAMASTAQWGLFHHSDDLSGTTYSGNYQTASFQNVAFTTVSVPGPVASLTASSTGPTGVVLNWTAATSAGGYRVERRSENGNWAQIIDLGSATLTFTDTAIAADAGYDYRVYAFNTSGNGPLSPTLRVTISPPDVVATFSTESSPNAADASVKASNTSANFGAESLLTVAGTSSLSALTPCSKMYLRFDLSSVSATLKSAVLRLAVAQTRNFAQSGFSYSGVLRLLPDTADVWDENTVSWDNAPQNGTTGTGFTGTTFTMSTLNITDPLTLPSAGSVLGLATVVSNLNAQKGSNGLLTFTLATSTTSAAIDFASKEHATLPAPALEVTYASSVPTRPSFFTAAAAAVGTDINLAWTDNSSTETGFQIERRPQGGSFAPLQTTAADVVAVTDNTTTLGVVYEYRIRAASAAGNSAWSLIVSAEAGGSTGMSRGQLSYAAWLADYGLAADLPENERSEGDGLPNLIKYALGLSPAARAEAGKPITGTAEVDGKQYLTLTFSRSLDATGVKLVVDVADSPAGPWSSLDPLKAENQVEAQPNQPDFGWETLVIKDTVPMSDGRPRFMRLSADRR